VHARSGVLVALELYARPNHESTGANPVYRVPSEAIARAFVAGEIADLEFNLPASSWSIVRSARKAPIFVKGGPGSGKTLVALYRALHVIEEPALALVGPPRVLYITYTRQLRDDARNKVERLRGSIPASLEIETFDAIGERLVPGARTKYDFSTLERAARAALGDAAVDPAFFLEEVAECIERRNVRSLDDYARLVRRGRGGRLLPRERTTIWSAYERYVGELARSRARDVGTMRMQAADRAAALADADRYDFVIVDEVQDLPWSVLALAAVLARGVGRSKHLMLVGDTGQSIYQSGFRWSEVGLRIGGGNVFTLGTSERNTREILSFARATIEGVVTDDAQSETADKSGEPPRLVHGFENVEQRREWLADDVDARIRGGVAAQRIAIVAHGKNELKALAETRSADAKGYIDLVRFSGLTWRVRQFNVHEAKTNLSAIIAAVEAGEEITIARAGHPVARIVPFERLTRRPIGLDDGAGFISDDFDTFVPPGFLA